MLEFRNNKDAAINTIYLPTDEAQAMRERIYRRYEEMKAGKAQITPKLDKWEKQYDAWRPNKDAADWQSNIVPPFTTTIVERALAEIIDQTIQPSIIGRGPEDVVRAKLLNYIKDYTWEIGDGDLELYAAIKQALILGKTVWQEYYFRDKRLVKLLKSFDLEKNKEEYVEKEVFDFDDVYGENVSLHDFFIDPMARTINRGSYKANDVIRRYIMNFDTFQEMFVGSIWDQYGDFKYVKPGGDLNYWQFYKPDEAIDKDNQVEVLMYWGRRPDKFIIMANDVVGRNGPNPFNHKQLPFAEGSDVPRLNGFWAQGEPKLLESIQDELTTLRRMRIDRQHMDIWKMFLVSNRENLDDDEGIIAPSRFLYVDDPQNSIKALEYGPVHPTAYQEEAALKDDGRQVTGVESPQPSATATQAAIFKESTMKSLRMKIWLLSRELLTNIVRLRVPNIVQYYSQPKVERIIGEKEMIRYRQIRTDDMELKLGKDGNLIEEPKKGQFFFEVTPDLIIPQYGNYDYKLSGAPTFPISKPLQQQKTAEFMQHPVFQGAMQSGYYDVGKAADELSKINDFDPDKFKIPAQTRDQGMPDEETLLEMANRENQAMLQGKSLPGTAYAPRIHTDVHLAFMGSEQFKQAVAGNRSIVAIFSAHVLDEEKAQEMRSQVQSQGGQMSAPQQSVAQGIESGEAKAAMPGRMLGGEGAPPPPMM